MPFGGSSIAYDNVQLFIGGAYILVSFIKGVKYGLIIFFYI